ncbi:MAG: AraC family transcriptional regulator [Halioglobus sp.]|nr:AraC family transcriptional regulator [Halioglobus sp.]
MTVPNLRVLPQHVVRSIASPLEVMGGLGFDTPICLKGTGILRSQLSDPKALMSLQQELTFYRNCLQLTGDPTIGLKLGEPFTPQRYGLFGYALLSAATFRHALAVVEHFGKLTFSFYSFSFGEKEGYAWFAMVNPPPIEQQLLDLYSDRDIAAAIVGFSEILGEPFMPDAIYLCHDGHGREQVYRNHFGTEVHFGSEVNKLTFDADLLARPLPQADSDSSLHMQQQCQMLIARLSNQGKFVDEVRMLILRQLGDHPSIESVAEQLHMSSSTLRRRLQEEGSGFRSLLDEIRFGLAKDYLMETWLPLEKISELLGYSEAGNFSHAFRRWCGESPRSWRNRQGRRDE